MRSSPSLGALISEHRCGRTLIIAALLGGPLLLLTGVGLLVAMLLFPEPHRPVGATVTLATGGTGIIALGVWTLVLLRRKRHTRILLYEGGIVELVRQERRELSWQDIDSFSYTTLYTGAYVVTQLLIVPRHGPRWRLNSQHVQGLDAIANQLGGEVTELALSGMRQRLAAGERVAFGKLSLSGEGLHERRRLLPWREIADVWVHAGFLRVLRHGDAAAAVVASVGRLQRVDALLTLIRENCRITSAHTPLAASRSFRQLVPRLVTQTVLGSLITALFFGLAGYYLLRAFRSLGIAALHHYRGLGPHLGWALFGASIGTSLAVVYYCDLARQLRQRRLARRLANNGKLVPVMVLESTFEEWSFRSGWRYRYLTPQGIEAVDRIDVGLGGAALWARDRAYLLALCSPDERESMLISLSGYPLARLPAHSTTHDSSLAQRLGRAEDGA